jgi:hypothetical protein
MNSVDELQDILFAYEFALSSWKDCVNWAVARLLNDEEAGDKDIILLAGSSGEAEALELARQIVQRHLQPDPRREELWAGKLQIQLYHRYKAGTITIIELERIISALAVALEYPQWLTMLSRNCEYATDIDNFVKPFEDEFKYICDLWTECQTLEDFHQKYDGRVSDSHDAPESLNNIARLLGSDN